MSAAKRQSDWAKLFRIACGVISQVNSEQTIIDHWTLGGGTAMMLQIDHRESHDVDIFLSDPQLLSFLDPQKRDFDFDIEPIAFHSDGAAFAKFVFENIGEIDFIVGQALSSSAAQLASVEGELVLLETIPEIITKKIYHRASMIMPRDLFDIAAAGERYADPVIEELRRYPDEVSRALRTIEKLNPQFVNRTIADLVIKDQYLTVAKTALDRAKEMLREI